MAVYRPTPKCPYCGEVIAKGVYRDQSKIPFMQRLIGDTFIRWDYKKHTCKGKKEADKKMNMSKTINDFIKELQAISKDKRELPLVVDCPNGETTYPSIKMRWDEPEKMLEKAPDKMVITWRD